MDTSLIKTFGQIAGIGGLALGVFLILFREVIRKNIFPNLEKRQAYLLLRLIIILVWSVAVLGLISWSFISYTKKEEPSNSHGNGVLSLPRFENGDIADLEDFIDKNRGKLVYINTELPVTRSEIGKNDGRDELTLSSMDDCNKEPFYIYCATSHFIIEGKNHELSWYKGMHRFNGFFVVGENVYMHQGVFYILESVARAQILIELQKKERLQESNSPIEK